MGHKRNSNKAARKTFRYGKGQDQKIHKVRNATRRQISETMCADQVSKNLKKYKLLDNYGKNKAFLYKPSSVTVGEFVLGML